MDRSPHVRWSDTNDTEAREDKECYSCAGKKGWIDWRSDGNVADEYRETKHGDRHG